MKARGRKFNWLYLCADERCVEEYCIDTPLGLTLLENEEIYLGCVTGTFLNSHVNQERTAFTFDGEAGESIRRRLIEAVRAYLKTEIRSLTAEKVQNSESIIQEHPQFLYLQPIIDQFVAKLPPNCVQKEEIYMEMCRHKRRRIKQFERLEEDVVATEEPTPALAEKVEELTAFAQSEQTGALAEYIRRRKVILVLLEKLQ